MTSVNGGTDLDTIPDSVVIGGTFRAFSNSSFYRLLRRIEEVNFSVFSSIINQRFCVLMLYYADDR